MKLRGALLKMKTDLNDPVDYFLYMSEEIIHMNKLVDKEISPPQDWQ